MTIHCHAAGRVFGRLTAAMFLLLSSAAPLWSQTITNLAQLSGTLDARPRSTNSIDLSVTVCAASRPEIGVLIVRDETGVELVEVGNFGSEIKPGDMVRIQSDHSLLRRREMGIQITTIPVVDNDGVHIHWTLFGNARLHAGLNPIRLDWFNNLREFNLVLTYAVSGSVPREMAASNFWHAVVDSLSGKTNILPGLYGEGFEGRWEAVPNFDLLLPVKTGIVTNLEPGLRPHDEMFGVRFTGFFDAPSDGEYAFRLRSDDGSQLFVGDLQVPVIQLSSANVPEASPTKLGAPMNSLSARRWISIEGRVGLVAAKGRGVEFELRSDRDAIKVCLADATGLDIARLQNSRVRATGVGRGVLTTAEFIALGAVFVAGAGDLQLLENDAADQVPLPIRTVAAVQSLPLEEARKSLPVLVRGVVTDSKDAIYERMMSIQDDTRGIFVVVDPYTNSLPASGQYVEVKGVSAAGDFAPVIVAEKIAALGPGRLPDPVEPTWTELLNGSMDVQWAEIQGLVTRVQSNTISLLMPEGQMDVNMDGYDRSNLEPYLKSVVRIRGVLYAMWNAETREVDVGSVKMRNAGISVEVSPPADPFNALVKTPRELLLFDSQATAFRRVKVGGQIVYADATQLYLEQDGVGVRILPSGKNENIRAGDLVEAVGYPNISRTALLLRDARVRKTGAASLIKPKKLLASNWPQKFLDATRVQLEGNLLGSHKEQGLTVLEMQSGPFLYLARLAPDVDRLPSLRAGSRLGLVGVYVGMQGAGQKQVVGANSFELLLNSSADIVLLSQPPWWTLQRLGIVVGGLLVVLIFAAAWIKQLHRVVEQRTNQLRVEIQERERVERQHALEAERSRIARDLHDDLGSSLTEISVLANTGQRPTLDEGGHTKLFRLIAGKARTLIAALDVIVWAVDPEDNSLQSFADYVTGHTEDFFSNTDIACRFKVPVSFPQKTLDGRVRHDLLMAVKEALNNVARHAEATEVEFRMAVEGDHLAIDITDNGKGFEVAGGGHGLKNLPARLVKQGGSCQVQSQLGGGTTVSIRLPLAHPSGQPV